MAKTSSRWTAKRWALCPAVIGGLLISPFGGRAQAQDECPTLFPDLRCTREARPEGSIMPMSFPYLFEDPYITTGAQFVGIWHEFPNDSAFRGGYAGVLALQARLAITDRLAFIATKDGFTMFRPDVRQSDVNPELSNTALLQDEEDFMDVTLGFKYALFEWPEKNLIVTPSLRYEIDLGEHDIFQGQGDGVFILATSAGWFYENWHLIADLGGQIPIDDDKDSSSIFYNIHIDHAFEVQNDIVEFVVPFIELSGLHYTGSGDGSSNVNTTLGKVPLDVAQSLLGTGAFEGADIANLGSSGISGADLVTMAWGVRIPLKQGVSLGAAYERPISNRKDIFGQRVTFSANYEF